eukprot:3686516-Karenia_brevis.AAC.1
MAFCGHGFIRSFILVLHVFLVCLGVHEALEARGGVDSVSLYQFDGCFCHEVHWGEGDFLPGVELKGV